MIHATAQMGREHRAQWKKPGKEDHLIYDYICKKCSEQANL